MAKSKFQNGGKYQFFPHLAPLKTFHLHEILCKRAPQGLQKNELAFTAGKFKKIYKQKKHKKTLSQKRKRTF